MKKTLSLVLAIIYLSACSLFMPANQKLTIQSNMPDAVIEINGSMVGKGSVTTKVSKKKNVQVYVSKPGYEPYDNYISSGISATGVLDIIGTVLIFFPVVGLFSGGAYKLDTNNLQVYLEKK